MNLSWGGRNRRQAERCKVLIPCKLVIDEKIWLGKTKDISLNGAFFSPGNGEPISTAYETCSAIFELLLPKAAFITDCEVVRVTDGVIGLRFVDLADTDRNDKLVDFLETQLTKVW